MRKSSICQVFFCRFLNFIIFVNFALFFLLCFCARSAQKGLRHLDAEALNDAAAFDFEVLYSRIATKFPS